MIDKLAVEIEENVNAVIEGLIFLERVAHAGPRAEAAYGRQSIAWRTYLAGVKQPGRIADVLDGRRNTALIGLRGDAVILPIWERVRGRLYCRQMLSIAGDGFEIYDPGAPCILGELAVWRAIDDGELLRLYGTPSAWLKDGNSTIEYFHGTRWRRGACVVDPRHWMARELLVWTKGLICDDDGHARAVIKAQNEAWRAMRPKHKPMIKVAAT